MENVQLERELSKGFAVQAEDLSLESQNPCKRQTWLHAPVSPGLGGESGRSQPVQLNGEHQVQGLALRRMWCFKRMCLRKTSLGQSQPPHCCHTDKVCLDTHVHTCSTQATRCGQRELGYQNHFMFTSYHLQLLSFSAPFVNGSKAPLPALNEKKLQKHSVLGQPAVAAQQTACIREELSAVSNRIERFRYGRKRLA